MPNDWLERCLQGNLLFSHTNDADTLMPEVGNGYLAMEMSSDAIYVKGLNNGESRGTSGVHTHRARIPRSTQGVELVSQEAPPHCGYALDLERAVFLKRSKDPVGAPGVLVEERWYAPLHHPTLLVHEIQLENPTFEDRTVAIQYTWRRESDDLAVKPVEDMKYIHAGLDPISTFAIHGSNRFPESPSKQWQFTYFALASNILPSKVVLRAGQARTLYALTVVTTSLNSTDPSAEALETLKGYTGDGRARAESLLSEHAAAWAARTEAGRIEVAGDLNLAQVVNASLYYLRTSVRSDWPYGLSPGGLASNCYDGRVYWDQEIWMFPPLLMLEPSAAESLLRYRFDRRAAARKKAQKCGSGPEHSWCPPDYHTRWTSSALMFPWESASSGAEVQYQHDGKLGPWGRYEQHVSGGVAVAAQKYWYATHNESWLREVGFPLASGIAAFYAARVDERPGGTPGALYDLNHVMGPDEYQPHVKNSAYSNAVARLTLDFAHEAATVLDLHTTSPKYADFMRKAQNLPIGIAAQVPGMPNLTGGYHPEYEGYPFNQTNPMVKQADTILLSYPVNIEMTEQLRRNDLEFYSRHTDRHGPAMTWSMFAVGWLSLGEYAKAARDFQEGYANSNRPYRVWSQFARGHSYPGCWNFITGAGGFLQSIINGVGGLRLRRDHLEFSAAPPSATGTKATKITVHSFHYQGARLRMEMGEHAVQYELLPSASPHPPLCLTIEGQSEEAQMKVGVAHSHELGKRAAIAKCGRSERINFQPTAPPSAKQRVALRQALRAARRAPRPAGAAQTSPSFARSSPSFRTGGRRGLERVAYISSALRPSLHLSVHGSGSMVQMSKDSKTLFIVPAGPARTGPIRLASDPKMCLYSLDGRTLRLYPCDASAFPQGPTIFELREEGPTWLKYDNTDILNLHDVLNMPADDLGAVLQKAQQEDCKGVALKDGVAYLKRIDGSSAEIHSTEDHVDFFVHRAAGDITVHLAHKPGSCISMPGNIPKGFEHLVVSGCNTDAPTFDMAKLLSSAPGGSIDRLVQSIREMRFTLHYQDNVVIDDPHRVVVIDDGRVDERVDDERVFARDRATIGRIQTKAAVVYVLFTVSKADYAQLVARPFLADAFRENIKSILAAASGSSVRPKDVTVALAAGWAAVAVTAEISVLDARVAAAVIAALQGACGSPLEAEANRIGETASTNSSEWANWSAWAVEVANRTEEASQAEEANRTGEAADEGATPTCGHHGTRWSPAQRRLWLAHALVGGISSVHGIVIASSGPVDVAGVRVLDKMPTSTGFLDRIRAWLLSVLRSLRRWLQSVGSWFHWLWRAFLHLLRSVGSWFRWLWRAFMQSEGHRLRGLWQRLPWPVWAGLAFAAVCLGFLGCCCATRQPAVARHWPFNGTWVLHQRGHLAKHAGVIVIINDAVHWQFGKEHRVVQMPDDTYQIMCPTEDDKAYSVELVDGDLIVDGHVFTRYRRTEDAGETERLIEEGS